MAGGRRSLRLASRVASPVAPSLRRSVAVLALLAVPPFPSAPSPGMILVQAGTAPDERTIGWARLTSCVAEQTRPGAAEKLASIGLRLE